MAPSSHLPSMLKYTGFPELTFLGPLAGKPYVGEDATVGSSREHVFRNPRFPLFVSFCFLTRLYQAKGKADKITFQCPSRPRNPGPLERIILNLLAHLTQDFHLPRQRTQQGTPSCHTPPLLPDVCLLYGDSSGPSWSCPNSAFSTLPPPWTSALLFLMSL